MPETTTTGLTDRQTEGHRHYVRLCICELYLNRFTSNKKHNFNCKLFCKRNVFQMICQNHPRSWGQQLRAVNCVIIDRDVARLESSFLVCNSRLRSSIRRHHPPQRAILSQICCFGERKVVLLQILLDGAEPRNAGTT